MSAGKTTDMFKMNKHLSKHCKTDGGWVGGRGWAWVGGWPSTTKGCGAEGGVPRWV